MGRPQGVIATILMVAGLLLGSPASAQVQSLRPPNLNAQYNRAETAWTSKSSLLEAKVRVDRVLKARPDDVEARKLRAQVLLAMDHPEQALTDAQHAIELQPEDGEARLILAEAARANGKLEAARQALSKAAELLGDNAAHHVRLSWNAMQLGQLSKAEAYARTALALDKALPASYYQLARVFVREKKPDNAALILARGFQGSLLTPRAVAADSLLRRVINHELLQDYLPR